MSLLRRLHCNSSSDSEEEVPRKIYYRERINFQISNEFEFKEKFRLRYEEFEFVLSKIGLTIQHRTSKNKALSPKQQLLTVLHWLGNGSQYHAAADMHGMHKSTVCRTVKRVTKAINDRLFNLVVKWPNDCSELAADFMRKGGFPFVCGCVDGTLINVISPQLNEEQFVDRHGNHSINAMMVCGPDLSFYYLSARWPGSTHDARVLRNSIIEEKFELGWRPFPNAILLGDSAYGLKEWLIPPYHNNPADLAERRFNISHKSCRRLIECAYGVLKKRFPCLSLLRVNPTYAANIIAACATLHNIATKSDFGWPEVENDDIVERLNENQNEDARGIARVRELLAFFA